MAAMPALPDAERAWLTRIRRVAGDTPADEVRLWNDTLVEDPCSIVRHFATPCLDDPAPAASTASKLAHRSYRFFECRTHEGCIRASFVADLA